MCCEIICCDHNLILEGILINNLLEDLFDFVNQEQPLDHLSSIYFSRTAAYFLDKKEQLVHIILKSFLLNFNFNSYKKSKVLDHLKKQANFVSNVVKHLYLSPISDFLIKLINAQNSEFVSTVIHFVINSIQQLIRIFCMLLKLERLEK